MYQELHAMDKRRDAFAGRRTSTSRIANAREKLTQWRLPCCVGSQVLGPHRHRIARALNVLARDFHCDAVR